MEKPTGNAPEAGDNIQQDPCLALVPNKDLPSRCLDIYEGEKPTEKGAAKVSEGKDIKENAESAESELTEVIVHFIGAAGQVLGDNSNGDIYEGERPTEKGAAKVFEGKDSKENVESAESELTDVIVHLTDAAGQVLGDISNGDICESEKPTEKGAAKVFEGNDSKKNADSAESELADVIVHLTDAAGQGLGDISNGDIFDGQTASTVHVKEVDRCRECIARFASNDTVLWSLNGQVDTSAYKTTSEAESKAIKKRLQTKDPMSKYIATLATPMSEILRQNIPEEYVNLEHGAANKHNKDGLFNRFVLWVGRNVIWAHLLK